MSTSLGDNITLSTANEHKVDRDTETQTHCLILLVLIDDDDDDFKVKQLCKFNERGSIIFTHQIQLLFRNARMENI